MNRRDFIKKNLQAVAYISTGAVLASSNVFSAKEAHATTNASNKNNDGKIKVGILLFDEVEVLDFAGPFEVFSIPFKKDYEDKIFDVVTVSETGKLIRAKNGLLVQPHYSFENMPDVDVLIIPGGDGADKIEINNPKIIAWIKEKSKEVKIIASVCTGAFLLAEAGLLEGRKATTHWGRFDKFAQDYPSCNLVRDVKFVDEEDIITSGGISAGINMSFHLVTKLAGLDVAKRTAKLMEYDIVLD